MRLKKTFLIQFSEREGTYYPISILHKLREILDVNWYVDTCDHYAISELKSEFAQFCWDLTDAGILGPSGMDKHYLSKGDNWQAFVDWLDANPDGEAVEVKLS